LVLFAKEPKLPYLIEEIPSPVGGIGGQPASDMAYTMGETLSPPTPSDNRAIVLYSPSDTYLNLGTVPSNPSLLVSPELLQNLKSKLLNLHAIFSVFVKRISVNHINVVSFYGRSLSCSIFLAFNVYELIYNVFISLSINSS
jgi:hypothetical protein